MVPITWQTPELSEVAQRSTGNPELAIATTGAEPPTTAAPGGTEPKLIVCTLADLAPLPITNDC
jgi:hypothetical protein